MANEYAVHAADLKAIADAIRAKGGTEDALSFPADFVSAVEAIQADGGSSGGNIAGSDAHAGNLMGSLLYAITSGTAARGEFTLASALPATETLIFDSGLSSIQGFAFANVDWDGVFETGKIRTAWGAAVMNPDAGNTEWISDVQTPFLMHNCYDMTPAAGTDPDVYTNFVSPVKNAASIRVDGGSLYITARYNANANYTPFAPGMKYQWFAW